MVPLMSKAKPNASYASTQRVNRLEHDIENMQRALEAQIELVADIRAALMPVPVDIVMRTEANRVATHDRQAVPTVRQANG